MKTFRNVRRKVVILGIVCEIIWLSGWREKERKGEKPNVEVGSKEQERKKQVESDYVPDCCYTIAR